mmetsp:Transcript_18787/g.44014  ORF Transcript_18787/g.44014 Transcript_18787/m.44014 type:complete len:225 (+) Transcript_18787:283-957(+)
MRFYSSTSDHSVESVQPPTASMDAVSALNTFGPSETPWMLLLDDKLSNKSSSSGLHPPSGPSRKATMRVCSSACMSGMTESTFVPRSRHTSNFLRDSTFWLHCWTRSRTCQSEPSFFTSRSARPVSRVTTGTLSLSHCSEASTAWMFNLSKFRLFLCSRWTPNGSSLESSTMDNAPASIRSEETGTILPAPSSVHFSTINFMRCCFFRGATRTQGLPISSSGSS